MGFDHAAQQRMNTEHTIRPQPGDYWYEMFSACFLVVWTDGEFVEYLDSIEHRKKLADGWTWNTENAPIRTTVEAFSKLVHYGSAGMADKCWADVVPKRCAWAVEAALETRRSIAP